MKSKHVVLIALLLMLITSQAFAEQSTANATLKAPMRTLVMAPFSGTLTSFTWEVGDTLTQQETLFEYATEPIYATQAGIMTALFVSPGDLTTGAMERYGAVCFIEPERPLYISATTRNAYNKNENKYLHIGESLYLKSGSDKGTGRVTGITEENYTVEILNGDFDPGDTIHCFRESNHSTDSKTGQGEAKRYPDIAIRAQGRVYLIHKQPGDPVQAGELLLETIHESSQAYPLSTTLEAQGILTGLFVQPGAQVYRGQYLCEIVDPSTLELSAEVDEVDIAAIHVGDSLSFTLDAFGDKTFTGMVVRICPLGIKKQNASYYDVRLTFNSEGLGTMLGMNGTLLLP